MKKISLGEVEIKSRKKKSVEGEKMPPKLIKKASTLPRKVLMNYRFGKILPP